MNPSAGWFQDVERPPGHLRYWDGQQWTEHRVPPQPGASASAWAPARRCEWVRSHRILTAVLVVLALALVGSWLPSYDDATTEAASGTVSEPAGAGPPKTRGNHPPDSSVHRSKTEAPRDTGVDRDRDRDHGTAGRNDAPRRRATSRPARAPTFLVTRVVDGDTVELGNGETVRLVGIDTPEAGECGFEAASANLATLVLGKRVSLGVSDEDRDGYGRMLRYVDVGEVDAGLRLIRNGRAIAAYDSRDGYGSHPREPVYVASDQGVANLCRMQTGQPTSPAPAAPKPQPLLGGSGSGNGSGNAGARCASGYSPCLPEVADLDCGDVDGPVRVSGSDPYRLDADGDGVGCDS